MVTADAIAMQLNLPTCLTLLRIVLIPVFVVVFYLPGEWTNLICTALFGLVALTDWLDGYLARRWGQTSAFGAFLDPVADKLIVATVLVLLVQAIPSPAMAVATAIIIGREIAISALREWMAQIGSRAAVAVSKIGKIKTTAQMIALLLLLYRDPILGFPTLDTGLVLLFVAALLTLWSMGHYLLAAWTALRR
ncbi:MAG: CDP-diacylglycerol--glycerol-3-phosphate 3-phosphatidyltransferase [Candidatus Competibacterales bacterium]|nr:CDP-diacylglycerol--glycerol-3-phosphate 3-phosphatidyltransferase [Candidatus Competibacterales bacterium]